MDKKRWNLQFPSRHRVSVGGPSSGEDHAPRERQLDPNRRQEPEGKSVGELEKVVQELEKSAQRLGQDTSRTQLCDGCMSVRIWALKDPDFMGLRNHLHTATLQNSAKSCPSCKLIASAVNTRTEVAEVFPGSPIRFVYVVAIRSQDLVGERIGLAIPVPIVGTNFEYQNLIGELCLYADQGEPRRFHNISIICEY
jgi:hypothetical protein